MNEKKTEKPIEDARQVEGEQEEGGESEDHNEAETPSTDRIEGEGSYAATRKYNADLEKALRKGNSEELAEKARKALEGPEGKVLEKAESSGKARRKD